MLKSICKCAGQSKARLCTYTSLLSPGNWKSLPLTFTDTGTNPSAGTHYSIPLGLFQDQPQFSFGIFLLQPLRNVLLFSQESQSFNGEFWDDFVVNLSFNGKTELSRKKRRGESNVECLSLVSGTPRTFINSCGPSNSYVNQARSFPANSLSH